MPVVIARQTAAAAPDLAMLRREALIDAPLSFGASPDDDFASGLAAMRDIVSRTDGSAIFGARAPRLVGMVGINRNSRVKSAHNGWIWGLYVRPEARGQGIGRRLILAAIDHARSLEGVEQIQLTVSETAPGARALYERVGFHVWGTEPNALRWHGETSDEHHMVLVLGPQA